MARLTSLLMTGLATAGLVLAPAIRAQTPDHVHDHADGADHDHAHSHAGGAVDCTALAKPPWLGLSDLDAQQIAQLQQATANLNTPEAARAAGFIPVLGDIPGMGVHYVNAGRTRAGVTPGEPDHLLFAPINGEEQLVGVAYAFRDVVDTKVPLPFESELAAWHDHPELGGGAGQTLHMLHVWFVPSSNGPFAGLNFWLPFRGAGVEPPNPCWVADAQAFERIQHVSFALAATNNQSAPFGGLFGARNGDLAGLIGLLGGAGLASGQGRGAIGAGVDPDRLLALLGNIDPAQLAQLAELFGGRGGAALGAGAGARGGAGAGVGAGAGLGARRAALAGAQADPEATARRATMIAALDAAAKADDHEAWLQAADNYLADLTPAERTAVNGLLRSLTLAQLSTPERDAIRQQPNR
jgi:hypothetical protein